MLCCVEIILFLLMNILIGIVLVLFVIEKRETEKMICLDRFRDTPKSAIESVKQSEKSL